MTLFLLWQEYKAVHPEGYQYSQFCERYRQWAGTLEVCLRQEHKAGEKMFVDWAGQTVPVTDPVTGQERQAQIFVAVLGRAITPTSRPPGPKGCPTGSPPILAPGKPSAGQRIGSPR